MNIKTVAGYLIGNARAIRAIASDAYTIPTGIVLVLLTAIARNYDQTYFLADPFMLFRPLLFSLFSGSFLFVCVYYVFVYRHLPSDKSSSSAYRSFMGLFWMTAPIAWLYAIPVERFLGSYQSAQANLGLLAIVSLWRVLLMARVFSVLHGAPFLRALGWVMIPACLEVGVISMVSGRSAKAIMTAMGGLTNSPEEDLLYRAIGVVQNGALLLGVVAILLLVAIQIKRTLNPFPLMTRSKPMWFVLCCLTLIWILAAQIPQQELKRNFQVERLVQNKRYRDALVLLSRYRKSDFAPSRQIPPRPYEIEVFAHLPEIIIAMDGKEAEWIRKEYLNHLSIMIRHKPYFLPDYSSISNALTQIPEGPAWLAIHGDELSRLIEEEKKRHSN